MIFGSLVWNEKDKYTCNKDTFSQKLEHILSRVAQNEQLKDMKNIDVPDRDLN